MDPAEILDAASHIHALLVVLVLVSGLIFTVMLAGDPHLEYLIFPFMALTAGSGFIIPSLLIYGVPRSFGIPIGGMLPTSCEASMAVEGPDGLPCQLLRFREWVDHVIADGSLHRDEIRLSWILACVLLLIFGGALVISLRDARHMRRVIKRRISKGILLHQDAEERYFETISDAREMKLYVDIMRSEELPLTKVRPGQYYVLL